MRRSLSFLCVSLMTSFALATPSNVVLLIHGGMGIDKKDLTPELEKKYRAVLEQSLQAGYTILKNQGTSLDAVEAAIKVMENSALFDAGKGSVFTHEGKNELDSSIMEGKTKKAGAVASVTTIKNPISAARAVMEKTPHVLLTGKGAEALAAKTGLEIVDPSYFYTEHAWKELQDRLKEEKAKPSGKNLALPAKYRWGTVGAVALDSQKNLAAGTSTGGLTNKMMGRVGDSPIIGAGTYADNDACAVSATGHGEYFIRYAVAHDIVSLMKYKHLSVRQATDQVVNKTLKAAGGEGGVIALDRQGNIAAVHNTAELYRGYVTQDGKTKVILNEE